MPSLNFLSLPTDSRRRPRHLPWLAVVLVAVVSVFALRPLWPAQADTRTWDGGGTDGTCGGGVGDGNKWSCALNWSSDTVPTGSDIALFNGTSTKDATINSAFGGSVLGLTITSGYTGTITQARSLTVGTSGYSQDGGTFTGATQAINTGPFTLSGGTFTSTSGTFAISGNFTVSGGTFTPGTGLVKFISASDITVDVPTSLSFYDLEIAMSFGFRDVIVTSGDTLIATHLLTLTNGGLTTGTIEAQDDFSRASTWDGGDGVVHFTSTNPHTFTLSGSGVQVMSGIWLDSASTEIDVTVTSSFSEDGIIQVTDGTLDFSAMSASQGLFLNEDVTIEGGTFIATPGNMYMSSYNWTHTGGVFDANGGGIVWQQFGGSAYIFGDTEWYNFEYRNNDSTNALILEAGSTQTVDGFLHLSINSPSEFDTTSRINIQSDTPGVSAAFDPVGQTGLAHVIFTDIDFNTPAECNARCVDMGGNSGIDFTGSMGVMVTDPTNEVSETGTTATFEVVLTSRPNDDATIDIVSADTGEVTVSDATLTFTPDNWETPQTVTLTGVDDGIDDGTPDIEIILGPVDSTDSRINGIEVRTLIEPNVDDDFDYGEVQFEQTANFSQEDVKNSASTPIAFYQYDFYGHGLLQDMSGGTTVDLSTTKIKPGCEIDIDGSVYTIVKVTDEATYGYTVTVSTPSMTPEELDVVLSTTPGVVNSITCTEFQHGTGKLNDGVINHDRVTAGDWWIATEPTVPSIWAPQNFGSAADIIDTTDNSVNTVTTQSDPESAIYDSLRGRMWVTNRGSDSVTAFNAVTGAYAFGTLGASSFAVGDRPFRGAYDDTNDKLWFGLDGTDNTIVQVNPATGAVLASVALGGDTYGVAYDSADDVVWVMMQEDQALIAIDASTATYLNGTLAASTYYLPFANVLTDIEYDSTTNSIWVLDELSTDVGYIEKVDASNGNLIGAFLVGSGPLGLHFDEPRGIMWIANDNVETWTALSVEDGHQIGEFTTTDCPQDVVVDSNGDVWGGDCFESTMDRIIYGGVADGSYYTTISNDNVQVDVSTVTSIDDVSVTETLNGESIYYAISFDDRHSFKVRGSWRTIASDMASDHGGVEGDWYYIDDTDTWTASPSNTPEEAISLAIENGPVENRTLDGATLDGLTASDWAEAGGFDAGSTNYINVAETQITDDAHTTPVAIEVAFSVSMGGTPGVTVTESGGSTDVTEGGATDTYDVVLDTQPTDDVTITITPDSQCTTDAPGGILTFTDVNWDTPQTVTVTGVDDDVDEVSPHPCVITQTASSVDVDYDGISVATVTANVTDNDTAGVTITESGGSTDVDEEGPTSDTYDVVLDSEPTDDVIIAISPDAQCETDLFTLTFTDADWDTPQTVTVTAIDDSLDETSPHICVIEHTASSSDPLYDGIPVADVNVNVTDNDTSDITVSAISGDTTEAGGTATFTVVLETEPAGDVVIDVATDDATEGTPDLSMLTFTALDWFTPQTVTVTGVDDFVDDGDILYHIVNTINGATADPLYAALDPADVDVFNIDDDTAGVTVTVTDSMTSESGDTGSFDVVLDSEPTGDVVIDVASLDTTEGTVDTAQLTFSDADWDTPQTVTVTGVDDDVVDEDILYTVELTMNAGLTADPLYAAIDPDDVNVLNLDDDTAGVTVTVTDSTTSESGDTGSFDVVLNSEPTGDVVIDVVSLDTTEGTVDTAQLTFTSLDWDTPQTVTVTGVDDALVDGTIAYTIDLSMNAGLTADLLYAGIDPDDVDLTNADNDSSGGGGGGGSQTYVQNAALDIGEVCTPDDMVTLTLYATSADDVMVGNDSSFAGASWEPFEATGNAGTDFDGDIVYTMTKTWTLTSGDGEKNVYAKFRSDDGNVSMTVYDTVTLDEADLCEEAPEQQAVNGSIILNGGDELTMSTRVTATLIAQNATEFKLSEDPQVEDAQWTEFIPVELTRDKTGTVQPDVSPTTDVAQPTTNNLRASGNIHIASATEYMYVPWDFSGAKDGDTLTLYVKYKDASGNESAIVGDDIVYSVTTPPAAPSSFVGADGGSTIYAVDPSGYYHAFPDLQTYLTYADSCGSVSYILPSTLDAAPKGLAMMPSPGTTLVKFLDDPKVYDIEADPADAFKVILRWISSEEVASASFGSNWADYVIEISPVEGAFSFGEPLNAPLTGASSDLRSRAALNGQVTYNIYIVNPDGERRFATDWAHIQTDTDGTTLYSFEDKTDMDYNDVVLRVDNRQCLSFSFSALPLEATYHHRIGVQVFYDGKMQDDIIISEDSHTSVGQVTVVNVTNVEQFTPYEILTQQEAQDRGFRASIFNRISSALWGLFHRK